MSGLQALLFHLCLQLALSDLGGFIYTAISIDIRKLLIQIRYEKPTRVSVYWDDDDHVTSASLSTYGGESIDEQEGVGMLTPSTHLSKLLYRNCALKLK
ncbi:MAG: hypothetical protein LUQ47_04705 [Methanotrichaceae archaeon]|nr:hypothetical protein [Methanotrichaceae archaeon]